MLKKHTFSTPLLLAGLLSAGACGSTPKPTPTFTGSSWQDASPADEPYLLAPGDSLDIVVHTAPELSRSLLIGPDGRVTLPPGATVMASGMTRAELTAALEASLAAELNDPDLDVLTTGFASQKIFIGGEVRDPGMVDLPGQIDPLQAVIMAGGFTRDARAREVVLMRRLPGGRVESAVFDLRSGVYNAELARWLPLQRFDVIYVPKTRIAQQNQFVEQYIRNALPVQFSLFYDVSPGGN